MPRALIAALALAAAGWAGPAPVPVETFGPFALGPDPARRLTVVATYRQPSVAWAAERTLASWTVKGPTGAVLFHQPVDPARHPEEFADVNVIEGAVVLVGARHRFLLVEMSQLPSAPAAGGVYFVFGFDRAGALRLLARLVHDGASLIAGADRPGERALADGRYLDVGEWTSWFTFTHRYEYDEPRAAFVARNRCSAVRDATVTAEIVAERAARRDNTIALRRSPAPGGPAERLTVTPATRVLLLGDACFAPAAGPAPGRALFLRIRVDGTDGWVHEDDFARIGLQQAG